MVGRKSAKELTVIDLYSGVGGLSLGTARAGFNVVGSVEIDPHASVAHETNFPKTVHVRKDIRKLTGSMILKDLEREKGSIDGVVGGPPCQGFSVIGKRNKNDSRNRLFVDFFRIVNEIQPKFFIAENVPGILEDENAGTREAAFSQVWRNYVILFPMRLSAHEFGAPTTRTRVFFIGFKKDEMTALDETMFRPSPTIEKVTVSEALKGLPEKIDPKWQTTEDEWKRVGTNGDGYYSSRLKGYVPNGVGDGVALKRLKNSNEVSGFLGTLHSAELIKRFASIGHGKADPISKSRRLNPEGFCPTLRAGTGVDKGSFQAVRPLHPSEDRVITPREAARLQGFPDWFRFSPTKWHSFRQIGNSVSPILAERIMKVIFKALN
jgi:DNA (cytosine-5)-methyltransferase 1